MKQQAAENKAYIEAQEAEERKLLKIIAEADAERVRQKKELDTVIGERDILGTQLVRRNDELALLYEKIKIQQSTLNKGEIQYNQRLEDIRVLKLEIKKLRREKAILQKSVANVDDLRSVLLVLPAVSAGGGYLWSVCKGMLFVASARCFSLSAYSPYWLGITACNLWMVDPIIIILAQFLGVHQMYRLYSSACEFCCENNYL